MPTMIIYGLVALAVIGALGGAIWKIDRNGYDRGIAECRNEWDKAKADQKAKEEKQAAEAAEKLEAGNAKAKIVYRTVRQTVDRLVDRPVYRDGVCLDDDGLRAAQRAIGGGAAAAPGKPDGAVPPAAKP